MVPAGVEVAPVVQRRAQAVDHLLAVDRVGALGNQMDPVAAIREQADRGLEVPEEPEAGNGKENLHRSGREIFSDLVGRASSYRLPPSHLQKGAYVSSAHTTTNYLERRS